MSLIIRKAGSGDIDALIDFNQRIAMETEEVALDGENVRNGLERLFQSDRYGFYTVAESAGEIVGSLMITYEWSDWRNGVIWWIQSVYVRADHRRQGVYRQLYENARRLGEEAGDVVAFRLYVEKENEVAQQTYLKMGMKETYYRIFEVETA